MSFDPFHASLSAYATLRIAGDALDPDYITTLIYLQPSEAWRKGDRVRLGKSETLVVKNSGMWLYRTSDALADNNLYSHLDFIMRALGTSADSKVYTSKSSELRAALQLFRLQLTASLFWHGLFPAAEPHVPSEFTHFIHYLGGRVVTDFASEDPELAVPFGGNRTN